MKHLLPFSARLAAIFFFLFSVNIASAENTYYARHFNLDENLPGSENPLVDSNWKHNFGSSATDGAGNANIVSGNSEGNTGTTTYLTPFATSRGFLFASGAGDSTTGFAPEAHMFWTDHLVAQSAGRQGAKASGTIEQDWGTFGENTLVGLKLSELASISCRINSRSLDNRHHIAFQLDGGTWYATEVSASATSWTEFKVNFDSATQLREDVFTPGSSLLTSFLFADLTTVGALDGNSVITAYGLYADTDDRRGTTNDGNSSWCRLDNYVVETTKQLALPEPLITSTAVSSGSFSANVETAFGLNYNLARREDLSSNVFTDVTSSQVNKVTSGSATLTDSENPVSGDPKAFYRAEASATQIDI